MAEETQSKDQNMRVYHAYSSLVGKFSFLKLQSLLQSQCIPFIYLEYNKEIMTQNKHVLTWSNIYSLYSQNRDSQKTEKQECEIKITNMGTKRWKYITSK